MGRGLPAPRPTPTAPRRSQWVGSGAARCLPACSLRRAVRFPPALPSPELGWGRRGPGGKHPDRLKFQQRSNPARNGAASSCAVAERVKMLLSEQEQFLSYNGEVLIFQLSPPSPVEGAADKRVDLCVRRMTFSRDTKLFVQKSSGVFSLRSRPLKTEIVCCSCTADSRTGIILPCILMKKKKRNNVVKYLLLFLHSSNQFEQSLQFQLDYELKEDVRLFAGPSVLWRHASKLFYISAGTCTVLSAPVQLSSVVWTGEIQEEGPVVLGIRTACLTEGEAEAELSTSDRAIWGTELFGYAVRAQKMLPGTCFMPHAYGRVVSSVCVCKSEAWRRQLRTSLVAVTHKNQLIWFQDGLPRGVCELPYEEPYSVKAAVTSSSDVLFVVSFASGNVCAVQRRGSLQVASKWQDVKCVLVDDFIGSGSEQLLLLFRDDSSAEVLSTFTITDLGAVSYASGNSYKDNVAAAEALQENGLLTVQALQTRLQAGCTAVRELQQHLRLKRRVLLKSCKALKDLVESRTHVLPTAKEESLVPLWDDVESRPPPPALGQETPVAQQAPEPLVESLWQRVVGDSLVVGVQLAAAFHLSLSDASLSLVLDQASSLAAPVIKCRNRVTKLERACSALPLSPCQTEPPAKKIKLDLCGKSDLRKEFPRGCVGAGLGASRAVTAVTSLSPLLAFHHVRCAVLLRAKRQAPHRDSLQQSREISLLCGKIALSLENISNGKYSVKLQRENGYCTGSMEDVLAMLAVSARFSFQVLSAACTLTPVTWWLLGAMECTPLQECPDKLFCHKAGNVHGTVLSWTLRNPLEGVLTLFCRNLTILFQCLHSLRRALPAGCDVKLLRSSSKGALTEQLALALEKEMLTSRSSFFSVLSSGSSFFSKESKAESTSAWGDVPAKDMSAAAVAALLESEEGVEQFRKELQSEQDQSELSMAQTMAAALYQEMTWRTAAAQLSSDMAVWRLSEA